MQKFSDTIATTKPDGTIEVLPSATVTVYLAGTTTPATIYSTNTGTAKTNPFLSAASTGRIEFYAADGRYDLRVDKAGYATVSVLDVLLEDPDNIDDNLDGVTISNSTLSSCILLNATVNDVDSVSFSDTPDALTPRRMAWNADEGTLDVALDNSTTLQLGQELHYRARNATAATIADGAVVWATGTTGASGRISVGLAVADGSQPGKTVMGLMTHATAAGSDGYVAAFGKVRGVNTTGSAVGETWVNGDILYLHPTIPGALTKVKPTVNGHIVVTVAIVIYAGNNGTLFARPTADSQEADEIRYTPTGTGAVATTVQAKLRESVSVKDFGATGSGDETIKIQTAVDATPAGGELRLEPTKTYSVSQINVTGKAIRIVGYGATLNCTGATGAIYKTDHGNKLIVEGVSFTGSGAGIKQDAPIQTSSQDELDIVACSFNMASGVYGIYINGGRNPRIQNCFFRNTSSGSGIYFKDTVSPFLNTCTFKGGGYVGRAVYYPGTGNGTDAGLIIRDCEIMGWDKGVEVVGCDWLVIEGSTIDYNNQSIKLGSQDRANISNNYIGSLGATPALWIAYDAAGTAPNYSEKIFVVNNTFTGHYDGGNTYDCILIDGANSPDNVVIANNSISFYTRYGINFSLASTRLLVEGNTFAQRTGFGVAPVYNSIGTTDSGVTIKNNMFLNATTISAMNVSALCKVNENYGCATENRGEAVAGSGVSTFTVAHGLSYTPVKSDISLTPTNAEAAGKNPYVVGVDATNITVGFTAATTATAGVGWRVRRYF